MDEVARLAAEGAPEGLVVVADEQTAGRGRAGRSWHAPPGTSLLCSILLRPLLRPERLTTLPLVSGVAVAEAIEALSGASCQVKWPNDVLIGGRKVAGVLVTSKAGSRGIEQAIVGIGVNVTTPPELLPEGATSIQAAKGTSPNRELLLGRLLLDFERRYRAFLSAEGRLPLTDWLARAAYLGERVVVQADGSIIEGTMLGVDADGSLLLRGDEGSVVRVVAGDLVRGPKRAAPAP
jgi:BirA family biotin operon repressor/biotin-[acetyl-CoA-carboxylase] ligase